MTPLYYEGSVVLVEEELLLCDGGRIAQQERVLHDLVNIKEFDRF